MIIRMQTLLFTDKPPDSSAQRGASEGLKLVVSQPLQELAGPGAAKGPGCWRGQLPDAASCLPLYHFLHVQQYGKGCSEALHNCILNCSVLPIFFHLRNVVTIMPCVKKV